MIVNGVWYVSELQNDIVIELQDGMLVHTALSPFRKIDDTDFKPYKGYHPRKMKGKPLPAYLYPFYGLEKAPENLSEIIRVRISPQEKSAFETYVSSLEPRQNVSDVIRDFIRSKINERKNSE